jgi:aryl-alcohol dehydrogenase-like predicted oxidoreductase
VRYIETHGERLSVIGLGTWQFGSREWGYGAGYADHSAGEIARRAVELGINLFDTAEIYGFGRSERILGEAIADVRDSAFIASKVFPVLPVPAVVARRAGGSARRLGISEIDLYQLHWPNPLVPLGLQMTSMRNLVNRGVIHHIGVSNYSLARWQAAERALGGTVLTNQVRFNLVDRRPLAGMTSFAAERGRVVMAYSPLAQGLLSGRYDADHRPGGMRANQSAFLPENLERVAGVLAALRQIGEAHEATPAQVALAWVVSHGAVVAIPGASSVAQLEHNAAAADLELSEAELAELTATAEAFEPFEHREAMGTIARRRFRRSVGAAGGSQ